MVSAVQVNHDGLFNTEAMYYGTEELFFVVGASLASAFLASAASYVPCCRNGSSRAPHGLLSSTRSGRRTCLWTSGRRQPSLSMAPRTSGRHCVGIGEGSRVLTCAVLVSAEF